MSHAQGQFEPAKVAVITVSDTRTPQTDKSGALICELLRDKGHQIAEKVIVKDELLTIRSKTAALIADPHCEVVILTGGTGMTSRDVTPQAIEPLYTRSIPGFGELFRFLSYKDIGSSTIQSRATAGLCGQTIVFALPGSTGACRLALEAIILEQIDNTHKPCNFRSMIKR